VSDATRIHELARAIARLERKVDFILRHLDLEYEEQDAPTPPYLAEVSRLLQSGRKIEAIKVYREATRTGLAEAKEAVESIERGLP
jgi:ribosomal protein L7/L12